MHDLVLPGRLAAADPWRVRRVRPGDGADRRSDPPAKTRAGSAYAGFIVYGHDKVTPFEPEAAKTVAMQMCLDAGAELLLHSFVVDAQVVDGRVGGLVLVNKSGMHLQPARVVIDCTADGDVAARAGVRTVYGRGGRPGPADDRLLPDQQR